MNSCLRFIALLPILVFLGCAGSKNNDHPNDPKTIISFEITAVSKKALKPVSAGDEVRSPGESDVAVTVKINGQDYKLGLLRSNFSKGHQWYLGEFAEYLVEQSEKRPAQILYLSTTTSLSEQSKTRPEALAFMKWTSSSQKP